MNYKYKDLANAVRFLSIDAIEQANSGHPGMPMGMADVATVLFAEFLNFNPMDPSWENRDRFILSNGHGSMLLYSILYLTGYPDVTIEDLKNFRKLHSKTPGHPEYGFLKGIETTTGPLGQGLANAVGIAISERLLANRNKKIDFNTYVFAGDGCLMEGISQEAISIAGHLRLNKLVLLFDDNQISIDGSTNLTNSENTLQRFIASGWNAERIDGHDYEQINAALSRAKSSDKPSLIACRTIIGYGSPNKAGSEKCHGAALGAKEISLTRKNLVWDYPAFMIPENILQAWRSTSKKSFKKYQEFQNHNSSEHSYEDKPVNLSALKENFIHQQSLISTRKASGAALKTIAASIDRLIGGSADLSESNNTMPDFFKAIDADDFSGRYIHYGPREHAMAAIMNGIALSKVFIPYSGSFLVFTDYCRPAIRLAAIMKLQVFYIMTHDSIGLGEDGPTHQPVEHLASLRAIPNLLVFRPASGVEVAECYEIAMQSSSSPSLFSLTRQDVKEVRSDYQQNYSKFGAYILREYSNDFKVTIFATGSEVNIAIEARIELEKLGIGTRVVSMPCWELFDQQDTSYQEALIENSSLKVAVEAAVKIGWEKYIGRKGIFIGMDGFGASAKAEDLYQYFKITKEEIIKQVLLKLGEAL